VRLINSPTNCPRCAAVVEARWLICPHCDAVLQGPERGSRGGLDKVARDRFIRLSANSSIRLLSVLGATAICALGLRNTIPTGGVIIVVGVFCVLVLLHRRPPRGIVGAIFTGAMATFGALVVLAVALALIASFFTSMD